MNKARLLCTLALCSLLVLTVGCGKDKDKDTKTTDDKATKVDDKAKKPDDKAKKPDDKAAKPAGSLEDKLIGKWNVDFEKMKTADPAMKELSAEQIAEMQKAMEKLQIVISKGKVEMNEQGGESKKGTYKVKSQAGNKIVLELTIEGEDKVQTETYEFSDDDHVKVLTEGQPDAMFIKRSK